MILIEGPDGVGKSTLAKALAREHKAPLVCFSPLPDWWLPIHYVTRACMPFAVYDRLHWSAHAYRTVRPQPWDATVKTCSDIDEALRFRCSGKYTRVLLYASDPGYFSLMPQDDMFRVEQVMEVNEAFIAVKEHFDVRCDVCQGYPTVESLGPLTREI